MWFLTYYIPKLLDAQVHVHVYLLIENIKKKFSSAFWFMSILYSYLQRQNFFKNRAHTPCCCNAFVVNQWLILVKRTHVWVTPPFNILNMYICLINLTLYRFLLYLQPWNTGIYSLNKSVIFIGYYFCSMKITQLWRYVMFCMQCLRFEKKMFINHGKFNK